MSNGEFFDHPLHEDRLPSLANSELSREEREAQIMGRMIDGMKIPDRIDGLLPPIDPGGSQIVPNDGPGIQPDYRVG